MSETILGSRELKAVEEIAQALKDLVQFLSDNLNGEARFEVELAPFRVFPIVASKPGT